MPSSTIDREREFTDEQVSEWILNRIFHDISVLDVISTINNSRWYSNEIVGILIEVVIASYKKHGVIPTQDAVIGNLKYLTETGKIEADVNELVTTFKRIVNSTINVDSDTVTESIELFIQDSGLYRAVEDYTESRLLGDRGKKKLKFSETLSQIHKFEDFKIDTDIGLDYFSDEGQNSHWDFLTNPEAKLPTGIEWIDKVTSGGIYRNGHFLGVVVAAPNVGKSIILSNLAYNFLQQDLNVLIISLEMSQNVYGRRITSLIADSCIDTLGFYADDARANIEKFHKEHPNSRLIIKEWPSAGATPNTIDAYIETLINKNSKPDVIVLDYLNLLKPSNHHYTGDKQYIQIGYITKEVRGLSTKYGIPIFSATQSNRAGYENTETSLTNISQSTAVAEDADFIMAAYRFDEDLMNGILRMKVIKSRLGGKDYPAHQYQIDKDTLLLIDKGDATIDVDDGVDLNDLISGANGKNKKKESKKKNCENNSNECVEKYTKPIIEDNKKISFMESLSSVSHDLDDEFSVI